LSSSEELILIQQVLRNQYWWLRQVHCNSETYISSSDPWYVTGDFILSHVATPCHMWHHPVTHGPTLSQEAPPCHKWLNPVTQWLHSVTLLCNSSQP